MTCPFTPRWRMKAIPVISTRRLILPARKPDPIRTIFSFGGYTEGWATYCEMLSYYYAPVDKTYAAMAQKNTSLILGLYSLADIGIHHEGWGLSETTTFFRSHGITDTDSIREIYDLIIS